ncbi:MAG: hypothetical protein R3E39_27235 [Anaerolineae bacterium]
MPAIDVDLCVRRGDGEMQVKAQTDFFNGFEVVDMTEIGLP